MATLTSRAYAQHATVMAPVRDLRAGLIVAYQAVLADNSGPQTCPEPWISIGAQIAAMDFAGPIQICAPDPVVRQDAISAWCEAVCNATGLKAAKFDVIIDETALMSQTYGAAIAALENLRARGCGVCLVLTQDIGFPLATRGRSAVTEVRLSPQIMTARQATLAAASEHGIALTAISAHDWTDSALLRAAFDRRV